MISLNKLAKFFEHKEEIIEICKEEDNIPKQLSFDKVKECYPSFYKKLEWFSGFNNIPIKDSRKLIIKINKFLSSEEWQTYCKISSKEDASSFMNLELKNGRGVLISSNENYFRICYPLVFKYWEAEDNESWKSFMYRVLHNIEAIPKCPYCENKVELLSNTSGFAKTCKEHRNLYMSDKIKSMTPEQKKAREEKRRATSLEKYGVDDPNRSPIVRNKIKETNIKKYGVGCSFQAEEVKEKIKEGNIRSHGYDNPMKNPEIRERVSQSNRETYNANKEEKLRKSNWKDKSEETIAILKDPEVFRQTVLDHYDMSVKQLADFIGISSFMCLKHLHQLGFENFISKSNSYSQPEEDMLAYVKSLLPNLSDNEILRNNRTVISPKELDIYIPSMNIALEFNGSYWHSLEKLEEKGGIDYHKDKSVACSEKGIRLLHIYEPDWEEDILKQKEIIKEFIFNNFKEDYELKGDTLILHRPINNEKLENIDCKFIQLPFDFGYYEYEGFKVKNYLPPKKKDNATTEMYDAGTLLYERI